MAEQFPASLQQCLEQSGFTYAIGSESIRSETDSGLAKVRRIYTKGINKISGSITMHRDDYITLYDFYHTTLAGGTKTFYYNHPITQVQKEFRFLNPPQISVIGGEHFSVSFEWEEML